MFRYLTSFVYSSDEEQPLAEHILSTLWYCKKPDRIMKIVDKMAEKNALVPVTFIQQLTEDKVTIFTHKIIQKVLMKYNASKWGVCKQVADMLTTKSRISTACAIAIGSEKAKWNKEFYHKIRVLKSKEMAEWRKYLKMHRSDESYETVKITYTKPFTIGLFNEPLSGVVLNPSAKDVPILSCYKGVISKNRHCRRPVEIPLDTPFMQSDIAHFLSETNDDEDIVIIAKSIGADVVPPEGVYICFMEDTESYSDRIYPFVKNSDYSSAENFFDMISEQK